MLRVPSGRDEMLEASLCAVPCGEFGEAHLLNGALSIAECNDIIEQATAIGLQRLDLGRGLNVAAARAGRQLRGSSRVGLESKLMSEEMWRRIAHLFQPVVVSSAGRGPGDEGLEPGVWRPVGLGDVWRIARYHEVGDFIGPHVDDHLVLGPRTRSLKTFNLYLNGTECFSGGPSTSSDGRMLIVAQRLSTALFLPLDLQSFSTTSCCMKVVPSPKEKNGSFGQRSCSSWWAPRRRHGTSATLLRGMKMTLCNSAFATRRVRCV